MTPKQSNRGPEYDQYMGWSTRFLIEEKACELYDRYQMGVLFRGSWKIMLEKFKTPDTLQRFRDVEQQTTPSRDHWLVWTIEDDPIPDSLAPLVSQTIQNTGHMPDRAALCQAYYGRPVQHADLFISNNKPSIEAQVPPLLTVGDLYFTVSPSLYLDRRQWRGILYDHVFARRGHQRDYTALGDGVMDGLRDFYKAEQGVTLGVGSYHAPSQTWRPILPSSPKPPSTENGSPA
jgi:hypothetical protein